MKKYISLVLLTVLLLGALAACGTTPAETTPTPTTPASTTPAPTTPAPTTPVPTTPAPTTPAPTTPVPTTSAPTTPAPTSPVVTTPVETPHTPVYAPYIENPYSWEQLGEWGILPERSFDSPNGYLGTYNGCSVYACWSDVGDFYINNIGGIQFWYGRVFVLTIKDGERYELTQAYEKGLLTTEDLQIIALCWYGDTLPEDPYDY